MQIQNQFNPKDLCLRAWLLHLLWLGVCSSPWQLCATPQMESAFDDRIIQHFGSAQGLPSDWIHDILLTSDGYLWVATHNGVARFDGLDFKHFNRANTPQLPANDSRALYESRDGTLWIGTVGGLVQFSPGRPGRFDEHVEFRGNSVHAIYEDSDHTMWFGTREGTWTLPADGGFTLQDTAPHSAKAFCQDPHGILWIGADSGLYRRQGSGFGKISHPRLPTDPAGSGDVLHTRVNALIADKDDLWIGANIGLLHMRNGDGDLLGQSVGQRQVYDLHRIDGQIYVATRHGLWRSSDSNRFEKLETGDFASCIASDWEGGIWVGQYDNRGLSRFGRGLTTGLLPDLKINCIYEDSSGNMWFGSSSGLHRLDDGGRVDFGAGDGLPGSRVGTISRGSGDTFWIGTERGFAKWNGSTISTDGVPEELPGGDISSAHQDSAGALWFAIRGGGGYRFENGELTSLNGLDQGTISWFHEDADGTVWVGHEYGLFHFADGRVQQVTDEALDRLNTSHFLCCYSSADGTLWLGTSGGIARYRSGVFDVFTTEDGLAADQVDRIVEDNHGNLWLGGRDGFNYINLDNLEQFSSGGIATVTSQSVAHLAGVPTSIALPKVCLASDGTTWIAGRAGVIRVAPDTWPKNSVPATVHIDRITISGETATVEDTLEFVSGRHRLAIEFSAPSFSGSDLSGVRFMLDGYDNDWVDAGSERVAYYTDLRPGDYRFRVIASNSDGLWNEQEDSVALRVRARWWERNSVRASLGLLAASTGICFFRHRTRRIRATNTTLRREISERHRAEESARRRAEELARVSRAASMGELTTSIAHEVNQPLFAIVSNAQTARRMLDEEQPDLEEVREALRDIADDGNRASGIIDRIRSLVRKEQPMKSALDLNEVAREVIKLISPEFRERDTALDADLSDSLPMVQGDRIELQQVILNLLINGAQSMDGVGGEPRAVLITTSSVDGWVELAVRDSGRGLDESQADRVFEPFFTTRKSGTGMGLAIIRTIVEAHGGKIWAGPNVDGGTTFRFTLPSAGDDTE